MYKKNNGIKVNIEIENLRETINLIRKLKYEVIELKKQGITSYRVVYHDINKDIGITTIFNRADLERFRSDLI